jgi:hypothetical protein
LAIRAATSPPAWFAASNRSTVRPRGIMLTTEFAQIAIGKPSTQESSRLAHFKPNSLKRGAQLVETREG